MLKHMHVMESFIICNTLLIAMQLGNDINRGLTVSIYSAFVTFTSSNALYTNDKWNIQLDSNSSRGASFC